MSAPDIIVRKQIIGDEQVTLVIEATTRGSRIRVILPTGTRDFDFDEMGRLIKKEAVTA